MRTLASVKIRRSIRPMTVCLALLLALVLISATFQPAMTADELTQDSPGTTQATFPTLPETLGPIPDGGTGTPPVYGNPLVMAFLVSGISAPITDVSVNLTLTHTWCGDLEMFLVAPSGSPNIVTVGHIGVTSAGSFGSSSDYNGTYNFTDGAVGPNIWTAAAATPIPNGSYRTTVRGMAGTTNPPAVTSLNSAFSGLTTAQANGLWTLWVRDGANGDTGTVTAANLTITGTGSFTQRPPLDFDGDGKTDYAVVRDVGGSLNWYLQRSMDGFLGQTWGASLNDALVPADYDGDSKWDIAVWRPGSPAFFYILQSLTGTIRVVPFGITGDVPLVTQDYDGDGRADPAVTRKVGGNLTFYILRSTIGFKAVTFGSANFDIGIRGDWDGDGKADVAVYRTQSGSPANTFYVLRSSDDAVQAQSFGDFNSDYIIPGDFDGDGKTDYAVWRFLSGTWYWLQSSNGGFRALNFGISSDRPAPGDYDGDAKTDQAVWRPGPPSTFYVNRSMLGFGFLPFGINTDLPVASTLQVR